MTAVNLPYSKTAGYRGGLPVLSGKLVTLRELERSDAPSLYATWRQPEVARYCWAAPPSVEAFERFIDWARAERATGKYIGYGIVPQGREHAVGIFELRQLQPGFFRGELGFAMDPQLWGTGIFSEAAKLLLDFAFGVVKVHRIEARAAVTNARGNAALRKMGARQEGVLRAAFMYDGEYMDQNLWAILSNPTLAERGERSPHPHGHH